MRITTQSQLLELLDSLYADGTDRTSSAAAGFWDELLQQPDHPLNSDLPDGSLVAWQAAGLLTDQPSPTAQPTALDIGCGLGRNAHWLATQGFTVTGIDIAPYAIAEAGRRAGHTGPTWLLRDFVREPVDGAPFDLVYDSGCFHHLAPHRRISYLAALDQALAPGGRFGICTFAAGRMGSTASDAELLRQGHLDGGVGYTLDELRHIFADLELIDARPMPGQETLDQPAFTMDFLNVALFRRPV